MNSQTIPTGVDLQVATNVAAWNQLNSIVQVHHVDSNYFFKGMTVIHPELECTGPAEYDLQTAFEQWPYEQQKLETEKGNVSYNYLKNTNTLASCIGIDDLFAFQAKGVVLYRRLYKGKAILGWKSVAKDSYGNLFVPFLYEGVSDDVEIGLLCLNLNFGKEYITLLFKKVA